MPETPGHYGVIVIGDELLSGKRQDRHLAHVIDVLGARGLQVAWAQIVGDDHDRIVDVLRWSQQGEMPVFCFGGIGATPDDVTRQAAAQGFGVELCRHPEAVHLIETRFGEEAYPNRILMADLPEDCLLIPNSHNDIPGFTLYEHHFFPGFPVMAWPMLTWVLERYYPTRGAPEVERALRVFEVRESDLVPLMNELARSHPGVRLFSLPHMGEGEYIEIGFRGEAGAVGAALVGLVDGLGALGLHHETLEPGGSKDTATQAAG